MCGSWRAGPLVGFRPDFRFYEENGQKAPRFKGDPGGPRKYVAAVLEMWDDRL